MSRPALSAAIQRALACLDRYERRFARAIASIINVADPDVIVLGGGLSNMARLYDRVPALWGPHVFSDRVDTQTGPRETWRCERRARRGLAMACHLNRGLIPLVAAFAINLALVAGFAAMAQTPPGGPDVIDLQLAMSPGVFKQIVDLWGPETVADVRRSIWVLDFLFPIAYAFLFSRLYRSLCETGGVTPYRFVVMARVDRRSRRLRREHPAARDARRSGARRPSPWCVRCHRRQSSSSRS